MRRRMAFACAVLAMATAISGTRRRQPRRIQDLAAHDAAKMKDGVTMTPLLTVGDVFGERLPVRGHPGRDLACRPVARGGWTST